MRNTQKAKGEVPVFLPNKKCIFVLSDSTKQVGLKFVLIDQINLLNIKNKLSQEPEQHSGFFLSIQFMLLNENNIFKILYIFGPYAVH